MPTYGLTPEGLVIKTPEILRAELDAAARGKFTPSIPLGDQTLFGHVNAILAEELGNLWELAETVNSSQDPDAATGAGLDALSLLTGTYRRAAAYSYVVLTLCGTPTISVPAGNVVATSLGGNFALNADATFVALVARATATAYAVGDRRTYVSRCYECTVAGTSSVGAGPTTTGVAIADGTVTWAYLGEGIGCIDAAATATVTGAVVGGVRDITEIVNPVSGWNTAINLDEASLGYVVDADATLRARREIDLAAPGTGYLAAIRQALLLVPGVSSATVFHNTGDVVDADGVPPHHIEALIRGGADADLWACLLGNVPAGIGTYGDVTGVAEDDEGTDHTFSFSRPEELDIHVSISVIVDALTFPVDGDAQIKTAIAAWGNTLLAGQDVRATRAGAQAYSVTGVLDVPRAGSLGGCLVANGVAPTADASITVSTRQLATFDVANISVATTTGSV